MAFVEKAESISGREGQCLNTLVAKAVIAV
jgi:hypothetical protein